MAFLKDDQNSKFFGCCRKCKNTFHSIPSVTPENLKAVESEDERVLEVLGEVSGNGSVRDEEEVRKPLQVVRLHVHVEIAAN